MFAKVMVTGLERSEMAPFIAVAKLQSVARKIRAAEPRGEQAAINECLISEAIGLARRGQSTKAFRHLALAKVPANSIAACCMIRSAQYGCASHGYPRVK